MRIPFAKPNGSTNGGTELLSRVEAGKLAADGEHARDELLGDQRRAPRRSRRRSTARSTSTTELTASLRPDRAAGRVGRDVGRGAGVVGQRAGGVDRGDHAPARRASRPRSPRRRRRSRRRAKSIASVATTARTMTTAATRGRERHDGDDRVDQERDRGRRVARDVDRPGGVGGRADGAVDRLACAATPTTWRPPPSRRRARSTRWRRRSSRSARAPRTWRG